MSKVEDIMSRSLKSMPESATLLQVHKEMETSNIHHIVITDDAGKPSGIVSDRDVKKFISPFIGSKHATDKDNATGGIKVSSITASPVITCKVGDTVKNVTEQMLQKTIHAVPITGENGKLVGIVTSTDLLKLLLNHL